MIVILSPAKKLDYESELPKPMKSLLFQQPRFLDETWQIASVLKKKSARDLSELMGISENLAELNVKRYKQFTRPFSDENARPALAAFKGDVYQALKIHLYTKSEFEFAQKHLRILSGLYGLLRPLDLIMPYRLEMGTGITIGKYTNLYDFWNSKITELLKSDLDVMGKTTPLLNLASNEYFAAVKADLLGHPVVTVNFKEKRDGKLKTIALNSKRARGMMTDWIIQNRIKKIDDLKNFSEGGYTFKEQNNGNILFVKE